MSLDPPPRRAQDPRYPTGDPTGHARGWNPVPDGLGPLDFPRLRTLLHQHTGILLEEGQTNFVTMRLAALAVEEGFEHLPRLLESLHMEEISGRLHRRVFEALAVSETSFFRDLHPFETLRDVLIPRLMAARAHERRLSIWSAACATGQEPYSLALLARKEFPELLNWNFQILGTDFSSGVLQRARSGRFTQIEINRGLPAPMLLRYFEKEGNEWCIRPEIRAMVTFREHNLVLDPPPGPPFDIVLIRNVLIYFDAETRRDLLRRIRRALRPDGFLVLGAMESVDPRDMEFDVEWMKRTVVLKPRSVITGSCFEGGWRAGIR